MKYFSVIILILVLLLGFYAVFRKQPAPTIPDSRTLRIQSRTDYLDDIERDLEAVDLNLLDYELNLQ